MVTPYWHGERGYSGVGLLVSSSLADGLAFSHPAFDFEQRIVRASIPALGGLTVASVMVPNGGKDFDAKLRFLDALDMWALDVSREPGPLVICGDLNVARTDRDIHPKERKPNQIGARENERALIERILTRELVDVGRALDPDNDNLFTWWAPWRNLKQRNIGWRIDYVMMSAPLAAHARSAVVQREVGSSDHGPVVVDLDVEASRQ